MEQKTIFVNFNSITNPIRSARCGLHVAAKLCPGKAKFGQVDGQRVDKFDCVGSPGAETGFVFDANSEYKSLSDSQHGDTLILNPQPWVAKGPKYLALNRSQKSEILWNKIRAT